MGRELTSRSWLAISGTMTGPLLIVLNLIPRALFGGLFFIVTVKIY